MNILESFEIFFREPLSILKTNIIQIVGIDTDNFFAKDSSVSVNFTKNKTQITVFNNIKLYNLLSLATARNNRRIEAKNLIKSGKPEFLKLSMSTRK